MVHSLGLTLYSLRSRRDASSGEIKLPRPQGKVVWMHSPKRVLLSGLTDLARRLIDEDGVSILLTCPEPVEPLNSMIVSPPPEDDPKSVRIFLDHWKPDVGLFSDGELRPVLLHEAAERGIDLIAVDGRNPYLFDNRGSWYPGLTRSALQSFRQILAVDETAARNFRKQGAIANSVSVAGRLEEESAVLPGLEAERVVLAQLLATRPVWLAAALPRSEETAIIAAHRAAIGRSHRLLLIIAPEEADRAPDLAWDLAEKEGFVVAERAKDQEPDPEVEIFVADGVSELGLWYRLAPMTFMGGSLAGKGCIRNPMEPAALGSAILYGPRPGDFGLAFGRLGAARAARAVGSATDLCDAVQDVLSPDKAAKLAQSAWAVASEGAEVTGKVISLVRQALEGKV